MNLRLGQPVRIEFEITDPINKQGQFGKIKKINTKEETAIIEFDDKKQGTYCFGTFEIPDAFNVHLQLSSFSVRRKEIEKRKP